MGAAVFEKIEPDFGSSIRLRSCQQAGPQCPRYWHYHPEYELVYINRGSATRHIGNHVARYDDGDLIMVGSNLPHRGFAEDLLEDHTEIIIQWHPDFLGKDFFAIPEMSKVQQLLERSQFGLSFFGATRQTIGQRMIELADMKADQRLHPFLAILEDLANSTQYHLLNASGIGLQLRENDHGRIQKVYDYVDANFQKEVCLDEATRLANMSKPAFCRYFKRVTGYTFMEFVNKYRVAQAARLLSSSDSNISSICFDCGFVNLSTFNKQFKRVTQMTPFKYRKYYRREIHGHYQNL
ncbi:MAG: AraC family transcriptional regulator [Bacteroidota bacterium]